MTRFVHGISLLVDASYIKCCQLLCLLFHIFFSFLLTSSNAEQPYLRKKIIQKTRLFYLTVQETSFIFPSLRNCMWKYCNGDVLRLKEVRERMDKTGIKLAYYTWLFSFRTLYINCIGNQPYQYFKYKMKFTWTFFT